MKVELETYNLDDARKVIIEKLYLNHPNMNNDDYAKELGLSVRQYYRIKNDLPRPQRMTKGMFKAMELLNKKGYKISTK